MIRDNCLVMRGARDECACDAQVRDGSGISQ